MTNNDVLLAGQMTDLLERELDAAGELLACLEEEFTVLTGREPETLERAIERKQRCLGTVEELERGRECLLASAGFGGGPGAMAAFLARCGHHAGLDQAWQRVLENAEQCRQRNQLNHLLVECGMQHAQHALCILRGEEVNQSLYGPAGDSSFVHDRRSLGRV